MPGNITQTKLQNFIVTIQESLLTSNNIVDRVKYPYFYDHPSVPESLMTYKKRLAIYRKQSSDLLAQLSTLALPEAPQQLKDLRKGTFAHSFIGSMVVASYGIGECAECATQLAIKLIQTGYGNVAFVAINFTKSKNGMETGHQFIVANVPTLPRPPKNDLSVYEFFDLLPEDALIADAFLGVSFNPKEPPIEFTDYINAFGRDTQVTQCFHLYNFTNKSLAMYLSTAAKIKKELQLKEPLLAEDTYTLQHKTKIPDTTLIKLLKEKSSLPFFGVHDEAYKVDAVVELTSETERETLQQLQRSLKGHGRFFELSSSHKRVFVLQGINLSDENPKLINQIQHYAKQK